jgi:acyl-CoA synthetase (AMP-forming)/AMP-acid ligase II
VARDALDPIQFDAKFDATTGKDVSAEDVEDFREDEPGAIQGPERDVLLVDELPRNPTSNVLKRELGKRAA